MAYNIERGFHTWDHELENNRLNAAQQVVKNVNPDILAITEACYGSPNSHNILMDYQDLFAFPYGKYGCYRVFGPRKGDEGGNCLLSKYPLKGKTIDFEYKGAVRGFISLEGKVLTVDVVHPSHSVDDAVKLETIKPLVDNRSTPYILTGDFNTTHPDDSYDWEKIAEELQTFDPKKADHLIDNWQKADLVSWILEQGLEDAFPLEARQSTLPTFYTHNKHSHGIRMDFFFKSRDLKVKEAYVLKNDLTENASDHYPIVGIFET